MGAAIGAFLGHLFDHVFGRRGSLCSLSPNDPCLPRGGPLSSGATIRRFRQPADLSAHATAADRHHGRSDRHGFPRSRSKGAIRHRHQRTVGGARAHAYLLRVGIAARSVGSRREGSRTGRALVGVRRAPVVQDAHPANVRTGAGRQRRFPGPNGLGRLGGTVDYGLEPVAHRTTRRRTYPLRTSSPARPSHRKHGACGRHRGHRDVPTLWVDADVSLAGSDGPQAPTDHQ